MELETYVREKVEDLQESISELKFILKEMVGKMEKDIIEQKKDLNNLWEKFREHQAEHNAMIQNNIKSILTWIALISGACIGLGVITYGLIWLFKTLKLI